MKLIFSIIGLLALVGLGYVLGSSSAQSQDDGLKVIWGGGKIETSVYSNTYVPHLIKVLEQNRLAGYIWAGESPGTLANAEMVSLNPTHLAVGQWDLLDGLNGSPIPGKAPLNYAFTVLAEDIGPECLYMVTDQEGYDTLGHVIGNAWDMTIATGGEGSGSLGTLNRLLALYPEMGDAIVEQVGGALDIVKRVAEDTSISHGFFVMRPDPQSDTFKEIARQKLHLIPLVDQGLKDAGYNFLELKVANGGFLGLGGGPQFHTTACTSVALITGSLTMPDATGAEILRADLSTRDARRVQATVERIGAIDAGSLKPDISSWQDMWDNLTVLAADKAEDLMAASKKALEDILEEAGV